MSARHAGRKMRPCAAPKMTIPKNCLKKTRKMYLQVSTRCDETYLSGHISGRISATSHVLDPDKTRMATKVEVAPCNTGVPMCTRAFSARSCRDCAEIIAEHASMSQRSLDYRNSSSSKGTSRACLVPDEVTNECATWTE